MHILVSPTILCIFVQKRGEEMHCATALCSTTTLARCTSKIPADYTSGKRVLHKGTCQDCQLVLRASVLDNLHENAQEQLQLYRQV